MSAPKMPPLPEYDDVRDKVHAEGVEALTPIERIVYEGEPAVGDVEWREWLQAALQEAFDAGLAAGRAAGTVTIDAPVVTIDRPARRAPSADFPGGF